MLKPKTPHFSVAMPVYKGDHLDYLKTAVDSILNQTVKTNDFVIVRDGPVPAEIEDYLKSLEKSSKIFHIVRLEENQGAGAARNEAIKAAKNELIAIMDADDIAVPDRFELQLEEFQKHPDLDILGGQIAEFTDDPKNIISYRTMPTTQKAIIKFAKMRSPFNQPTVMYKKSTVVNVGMYDTINRAEDYGLWLKLIMTGAKLKNLDQTLLYYRVSKDNYARRFTRDQTRQLIRLKKEYYRAGFLSLPNYLFQAAIYQLVSIVPANLKKFIYEKLFRKSRLK